MMAPDISQHTWRLVSAGEHHKVVRERLIHRKLQLLLRLAGDLFRNAHVILKASDLLDREVEPRQLLNIVQHDGLVDLL